MFLSILILLLGLATLIVGGEFLLKGAVGIAKKFKISSLVIGMTVVAFGTSAPELIVSITSALQGHPEIAIGNVVGSNIANLALVLGLTVIIFPMVVTKTTKVQDWPKMMYATLLFLLFAMDGIISRWEGAVLFISLVAFIWYIIGKSRKRVHVPDKMEPNSNSWNSVAFLLVGLTGLYFGSDWLLIGAVDIAREVGMTEHAIGITIVAFGTSVPELVTSCVAAFKKETDISIGNLIGSNIFNISAVLGITSMITPIGVGQSIFDFDAYWLVGIPMVLLLMMWKNKIGRASGIVLFGLYITYVTITLVG